MNQDSILSKKYIPIILGIGIPASIRNLAFNLQQIIDTMFLGQYNSDTLLAVSTISMPFWLMESLWIGIATATGIMIAHRVGAKNRQAAAKVAQVTFIIGGGLSICYFVFWQIMSQHITFYMNISGQAAEDAQVYIKTLSFIYFFRFIGSVTPASIMEALGNTRIVMWATIAQSLTNVILDPIFIWGIGIIPEMGIFGAALATLLAELVAISIKSIYFWKKNYLNLKHTPLFPLQWDLKERLTLGIPTTLEFFLWGFTSSIIVSMINKVIPYGGAIYHIGFLLIYMSYRLLYGIDIANISLTGRAFGAKRKDRMMAIYSAITRVKWSIGLILITIIYCFQSTIISLFSKDPLIINATSNNIIWILGTSLITISMGINKSSLNAMGYSRYNFFIDMVGTSIRMVITFWSLFYSSIGVSGVWVAICTEEFFRLGSTTYFRTKLVNKHWQMWAMEK